MNYINLKKYLIICLFLLSLSVYAAKEFTGTVVTLVEENLAATSNAYDRGWINYTPHLGQIVRPPFYNAKNEVVIPGDILIYGDPSAWTPYLKADQIQLAAAKKMKDLAGSVYHRYKKMAKENAISDQDFTDAKSVLANAIGRYLNYLTVLKQGQIAASRFLIAAPFEGIVTGVTQGTGSDVGGAAAVDVIQLNPIGIKIDVSANEQTKISRTFTAKIYVNGLDKPLGAYHTAALFDSSSVTLATKNYPVIEKNTIIENNNIPVLREWMPVIKFDVNSTYPSILAVSEKAVEKDEKGSYVWKAKGQKLMQTDKGIDYTFPIEKVYITAGDQTRYYTSYAKVINLKDNGGLEKNDLVLNNPPKGLKDGEKVIYPQQAYLLMPGDKVRVVISDNEKVK